MAKGYSYYLPIEQAKGRFYMRKHFTNNFQNITEQQLEQIKKDAETFRLEKEESNKKRTTFLRGPVSLYSDAIFYLTNPCINETYPSFDEKMLFLIHVVDPEYKIARTYTQAPLLTAYEQKQVKPEETDKINNHKRLHESLYHGVENHFGFSDPYLIQFERTFFNRFMLQKELLSNIQANHIQELFDKAIVVRSYERTSDEEYQEAINIAEQLIATQPDITNPNTVAFNILKQNKLIGGNASLRQTFLIFILSFDPELKMLQIYYDESMVPKMEERANNELGFYNTELIRLEQEYHKRFQPDKIISPWQI